MALTYDDLTSKTNKHIVPRLVDSVYKSSPIFTRLRTKNQERFEGGESIKHPIMYAELKGGAYTRGQTFDTSYVQTDTAFELKIKFYYVNCTLYGTDNVLNRGPEAAMSLVESKMVNASGKMAKMLGSDIFLDGQGTGSQVIQLDGLDAAFDDGNRYPAYAGLTRANIASGANLGINAYYATTTLASMALTDWNTALGATWFGSERTDLVSTTQLVWNALWSKIQPAQRFMEESADVAKVGFQAMRFNGVQIVVDQYCPAGKVFGMNSKYINFYISAVPKYQFGFTGWKEAQNTDDVAGQYLFAGNILCTAPRLQFQLYYT